MGKHLLGASAETHAHAHGRRHKPLPPRESRAGGGRRAAEGGQCGLARGASSGRGVTPPGGPPLAVGRGETRSGLWGRWGGVEGGGG